MSADQTNTVSLPSPYEGIRAKGTKILKALAENYPDSIVKLYFGFYDWHGGVMASYGTYGTLVTTAANAVNPKEPRFYPGKNESSFMLAMPLPYWPASQCYAFSIVQQILDDRIIKGVPAENALVIAVEL